VGLCQWNDAPTDIGKYLIVLATEWAMLNDNGQYTTTTENEIMSVLNAIRRIDDYAEVQYNLPPKYNGCFYRDDIPMDFAKGYDNFGSGDQYLTEGAFGSNQNVYSGYDLVQSAGSCRTHPDACDASGCGYQDAYTHGIMSQDQAIKMILGLYAVWQLLPDYGTTAYLKNYAAEEAAKIIAYIRNSFSENGGINHSHVQCIGSWLIVDPNGRYVCRGSDSRAYSWAFAKLGNKIDPNRAQNNFHNYQDVWSATIGWTAWTGLRVLYSIVPGGNLPGHDFTDEMPCELAVMTFEHPIHYHFAGYTFTIYPPDVWSKREIGTNAWSYNPNDASYTKVLDLLSAVLNYYEPVHSQTDYENLLNNYPCISPGINIETNVYNGQTNQDAYEPNGLDYMMLFNLYAMKWRHNILDASDNSIPTYSNLLKREFKQTASLPYTLNNIQGSASVTIGNNTNPFVFEAANTLELRGTINDAGRVDFNAPHITLLPGFWAKTGSVSLIKNGRMQCVSENLELSNGWHTSGIAAKTDETDNVSPQNEIVIYDSIDVRALLKKQGLTDADIDELLKGVNVSTTEEGDGINLTVYPNPFLDNCNISLVVPDECVGSIEIFDLLGNKVATVLGSTSITAGVNLFQLNTSQLTSGTYLISYTDNKQRTAKQRIVKN
jgi:hypothetical protein